ncbi:MAG: histidine phosphatase family protein [Desulfobulbaceae bacterium]|nr:histidine phosphatase family protein [Desulfobulbaceae bacterium]
MANFYGADFDSHRILLICRHAKSSWEDSSLNDFERPLNKRGLRDAPVMGQRLRARGFLPDLIVSSPAVRAQRTAEMYAEALEYPLESIQYNQQQYAATWLELLSLIQQVDDRFRRIFLVGHNPESTSLANALGGLAIANIPTAGMVALSFHCSTWTNVREQSGKLLFFDFPKNPF